MRPVLVHLCMHGVVDSDVVPLWRPLQTSTAVHLLSLSALRLLRFDVKLE